MSTQNPTPDYAGLSKQEVAERLKTPTPDATATPRKDADKLATELIVWSSLPLGTGINQYEFSRVAREAAKLLRELTAAKAEIARLSNLGWFGKYHKAEADNAQLRAQLRERTQWQCACGGTDCAGQAENERLRAEVERQTRETTKWAQSLLARTEAAEVRAARWKEQAEFSETQRTKLDGENDQLRARVADLESQLAASATKAAAEYGEQLKPLFAKVRELEADKARLLELLKVAVCPDPNCDGQGSSWHVEQSSQSGEPEQVQHQCQWCDERKTAIEAARAGKGTT